MFFWVGLTVFFLVVLILCFLYLILSSFEFMTISSFECGFDSIGKVRMTFNIPFFMVMMVFALFDLEIVLLLGFMNSGFFLMFIFLMLFIYFTYYLEVYFGSLMWTNYFYIL